MKPSYIKIPALTLLLSAGALQPAAAAIVTLTSPDNKWSLSSDEFGASGEAVGGSFAKRDFGAGLTGYTWASSVLFSDGVNRQALTSDTNFGFGGLSGTIGAGNLISDGVAGSVRTSVFNVPGFAGIQVRLTQTASNSGLTQQYLISNSGASAVSLSAISFHDVDLDGGTFLNDFISVAGGMLKVSESARDVYFSPSPLGYVGFLAGYVAGGGITGNLDVIGYNNFGIPGANLNQFRDVGTGAIGANMDANSNGISDVVGDVGYLFQHNVTIPAGGSTSLIYTQLSAVPEPSAALLGLFAFGLTARRRR